MLYSISAVQWCIFHSIDYRQETVTHWLTSSRGMNRAVELSHYSREVELHGVNYKLNVGTHPLLDKRNRGRQRDRSNNDSRSSVSRDGCERLRVCQLGLWQSFVYVLVVA